MLGLPNHDCRPNIFVATRLYVCKLMPLKYNGMLVYAPVTIYSNFATAPMLTFFMTMLAIKVLTEF